MSAGSSAKVPTQVGEVPPICIQASKAIELVLPLADRSELSRRLELHSEKKVKK